MASETIIDIIIAVGLLLLAASAFTARKPRHIRSGVLNSADVANAIRKVQRP